MGLGKDLGREFSDEIANTYMFLERIPEGKLDWKPHVKSMTMRQLALHLASFPSWAVETLEKESIDIAPPGGAPYQPPVVNSRDEILEMFQRDSVKAKGALGRATDVDLQKKWTLLRGGKTIFSMPRIEVLRRMVMNHMIHHRAQIGVYLRLNDLPVPAIYGPSADEGRFL